VKYEGSLSSVYMHGVRAEKL